MTGISALIKLSKAIEALREEQTDFPAGAIHCLLTVMQNDGITQQGVAHKLDMPKSTCSRNMRLLSPRLGPGKEGMGLIDFRTDPMDYRVKGAYLTAKGEALRKRLTDIIA